MEYKITTYSEEETIELAQNIESEKFQNMFTRRFRKWKNSIY